MANRQSFAHFPGKNFNTCQSETRQVHERDKFVDYHTIQNNAPQARLDARKKNSGEYYAG
jgi:hypothetical protein